MPELWDPKKAILTPRSIGVNVLDYVTNTSRQEAALKWAGGSGLKLAKKLESSILDHGKPEFPAISFRDDTDEKEYANDVVPAIYSALFEVSIQGKDPHRAVEKTRIYAKAFESMIVNCPDETLLEGTGAMDIILLSVETGFLTIKGHETRENDFLQQFQIRAGYALKGLSHNS